MDSSKDYVEKYELMMHRHTHISGELFFESFERGLSPNIKSFVSRHSNPKQFQMQ